MIDKTPIVSDLDDTLIDTDCFYEAFTILIKRNLLYVVVFPFWYLKGLPNFKEQVFSRASLDVYHLPFNQSVITFIKAQKKVGRTTVLATATPEKVAVQVNEVLQIFDVILGSTDKINLKSANKTNKLVELYGKNGFDYIGDSIADIDVWRSSRKNYLVAKNSHLTRQIETKVHIHEILHKSEDNWNVRSIIPLKLWLVFTFISFLSFFFSDKQTTTFVIGIISTYVTFLVFSTSLHIFRKIFQFQHNRVDNRIGDRIENNNSNPLTFITTDTFPFRLQKAYKILVILLVTSFIVTAFYLSSLTFLFLLSYFWISFFILKVNEVNEQKLLGKNTQIFETIWLFPQILIFILSLYFSSFYFTLK